MRHLAILLIVVAAGCSKADPVPCTKIGEKDRAHVDDDVRACPPPLP